MNLSIQIPHLVCVYIYGFNITIIAAIFMSFFRRLVGRRWGVLLAGLGIAYYTLLVGADSAVVRAALMGGLTLLARVLGRRTHGFAGLSAAAFFMTAINGWIEIEGRDCG